MNPTKSEKSGGPHSYQAVRPPNRRVPGARDNGSNASGGMKGRTPMTQGRGTFSGSPSNMGSGCDWGSPHKTSRHPSTSRGAN
jgi:hypothetical protein